MTITGNFAGAQDVLSFTNTSNITGSYNASDGVLTLTGTTTVANYQAALQSVEYQDTSLDPSTTLRTVSFSFQDSHATSNAATDNVSVTQVNNPPTISVPVETSARIGHKSSMARSRSPMWMQMAEPSRSRSRPPTVRSRWDRRLDSATT